MNKMHHITRDGTEIPIRKLGTQHLKNIIAMIERQSQEGMETVTPSCYGLHLDNPPESITLYGDDVTKEWDYQAYVDELNRRHNNTNKD